MTGACTNFGYVTKVSVPFFGQGLTPPDSQVMKVKLGPIFMSTLVAAKNFLDGRMAALGTSVVSMSFFQSSKTIPSTPCLKELYRMYTTSAMDSWIDLCMYPFPNVVVINPYLSPDNVTIYESKIWCTNCPTGPFLDYSYLKYDTNTFDPPCKLNFKNITTGFSDSGLGLSLTKTYSNISCYLSLNFVDDQLYGFNKQFTSLRDQCASPIQCPVSSTVTGRRLLGGSKSSDSGMGTSPSDMRLKTNVLPTGRHIASLPEYTWQWNDVAKALRLDGQPTIGVMAQEAQAVLPQAVSTGSDGYLRVDYGLLSRLS